MEQAILQLSDGDLVMGDHEDYLYTYNGSERIGGNSSEIPSLGCITDSEQIANWTRLRSVLKDNCLYSYQNDSTIACFEIPIHLPGYYILTDKQMLLSKDFTCLNNRQSLDLDENLPPKQLVVFKLVTYHRLFMFAVESLAKLVRWIVRFGYRYCCNPTEPQLCFTYYLSPSHISESQKCDSNKNSLFNCKGNFILNFKIKLKLINSFSEKQSLFKLKSNELADKSINNKCQDDKKQSNVIEFSESDDYLDILTVKSSDSGSVHVKFKCPNSNENGNNETNLEDGSGVNGDEDDDYPIKDSRRFLKSPHPRGSARFAVKPLNQELNFIDSIVDAEKALAEQMLQEDEMIISIW